MNYRFLKWSLGTLLWTPIGALTSSMVIGTPSSSNSFWKVKTGAKTPESTTVPGKNYFIQLIQSDYIIELLTSPIKHTGLHWTFISWMGSKSWSHFLVLVVLPVTFTSQVNERIQVCTNKDYCCLTTHYLCCKKCWQGMK